MANRAIEPVTLPWKRPEKGVSVAEMGASFRVELREDGWHCTVKVGRRAEVLASGLRRLRDAQCRAEAHAATLPEVAAAREKLAAEESRPASHAKQRPANATTTTATDPRPVPPATTPGAEAPSLAFEQVSDGCICGKIDGGTWVADPGGGVSVPTGTDPAVAQEICRVAAAHYTARRSATTPANTTARASTKPTNKRGGRNAKPAAAPAEPPRAAKPAPEEKPAPARRAERARKPAPAKKATPTKKKAKPTKEPAAPTPASTSKPAKAPRTEKGKATSKRPAATPTPPAKAAAKGKKPAARGRKTGKARATNEKPAAAPTPPAKEEKVSKKPAKNAKTANDDSCGCVTWAAVDNKIRGAAKHGTFVVEPEGKRHALYFYDADGQSRHLESGEPSKLRKIAEEMAARGQPAPRAAVSGVDDAALMRAFLGDDA